jgi:carboxymethylenebutenolidase
MSDDAPRPDLAAVFDAHMAAEFERHDAAATMQTMSATPSLTHIPVVTGGYGREALHDFYRDHFVTKWPADTAVERVSRTVGDNMVIDELIVTFTHDVVMDAMVPGIAPTGRRVEAPHVVVVGFEDGMVAFERVYWDQASVLVQLGLLDPVGLPVTGAEQAEAVRDPTSPRNALIERGGIT